MGTTVKNIYKRPGRNLATMAAVAISMALMVSMQSLADGLLKETLDDINSSRIDILITTRLENGILGGHALMERYESNDDVELVSPMLMASRPLQCTIVDRQGNHVNRSCFSGGVMPDRFHDVQSDKDLDLYEPKETVGFATVGDPHYNAGGFDGPWTYEVVVSKYHADYYGLSIGDSIQLAARANIEPTRFNITGFLDTETTGEGFVSLFMIVMLHLSELQTLTDVDVRRYDDGTLEILDRVDTVAFRLDENVRTSLSRTNELKDELSDRFPFHEVSTKEDRIKEAAQRLTMIKGFTLAVSGVSLMIGLLFVATVMVMSVFERTNEIGMLRAIGISRSSIFKQFVGESMSIVFAGAVVGIFIGFFLSQYVAEIIERSVGVKADFVVFSPLTIGQVFVVVLLMGLLASTGPAWKAMNMNIVEALKKRR